MADQDEFHEVDDGALDDFEAELEQESRSRKKKRLLVIGGVIAGVVIGLFVVSGDKTPTPQQQAASQIEKTGPKETAPRDIEAQIAQLQQENRIDEDFKAPGALTENKPMEPAAKPQTAEEQAATAEPQPSEPQPAATIDEKAEALAAAVATPEPAPGEKTAPAGEEQKPEPVIVAKAVAPQPVKPAPAEKKTGPYSVQSLATTDSQEALRFRDELLRKGFPSWISIGKARQVVYRVQAGEFRSIREASRLSAMMAEAGFVTRPMYIKNRSKVTLVAGVFSDRRRAQRLRDSLAGSGFPSMVSHGPESLDLYMVRVGKYKTKREAVTAQSLMHRKGMPTLGVVQ